MNLELQTMEYFETYALLDFLLLSYIFDCAGTTSTIMSKPFKDCYPIITNMNLLHNFTYMCLRAFRIKTTTCERIYLILQISCFYLY